MTGGQILQQYVQLVGNCLLYTSVERLKEVAGISDKTIERIMDSYQYDRVLKKILVKFKI